MLDSLELHSLPSFLSSLVSFFPSVSCSEPSFPLWSEHVWVCGWLGSIDGASFFICFFLVFHFMLSEGLLSVEQTCAALMLDSIHHRGVKKVVMSLEGCENMSQWSHNVVPPPYLTWSRECVQQYGGIKGPQPHLM